MTKRSTVVIATTVVVATGAALIGRSWVAGDERGSAKRQTTTVSGAEAPMMAAMAAKIARRLVETYKLDAATDGVRVLHCKLATPRQRYWCADARPLTPAALTAEIIARPKAQERDQRCVVQSENGDLWTIGVGGSRCW
ncbi:MAG TPA: hypothetical protein VHJ58_07160 [Vicinamibacterales bacterium]|jgi:hypothetical protein|nr:hypothetical protein [Vicinamibacterales bacterium]